MKGNIILCGLLWSSFFTNCMCLLLTSGFKSPEVDMDVKQIVEHHGYPIENHDVTTEDGYILTVQRIPYGLKNRETPRQVVLLQHGLLDSSFTWVNNGPEKSLGFILADSGFDVWLSNSRGNLYSKRHTRYSSTSSNFWDFTWDDMATYDLPAVINYALSVSKAEKLGYIGHSQGGAIGCAQFSKNTDLNSKVSSFVALAPATYIGYVKSAIRLLAGFSGGINLISKIFTNGEFLPNTELITILQQAVCGIKIVSPACGNIAFLLMGFNEANLDTARLPIYLSHVPAGSSMKNINHYAQSYLANAFQYYDYGMVGNFGQYRQTSVPKYLLNTNGLPVAMFYGGNDWLVSPTDVKRTISELGDNVKFVKYIPQYNHIDFVWGLDANQQIYPDIISFLKKYNA